MAPYTAFPLSDYGYTIPISIKNGLNNNTIYDIYHGNDGFVWFATDMGISRYDGFRMHNFPLTTSASIHSDIHISRAVASIHRGVDGLLLLRLAKGGIACFDPSREVYIPVSFDKPLKKLSILSLYIVDNGNMYVGTADGLYSGVMKRITIKGQDNVFISLSQEPLVAGNITRISGMGQDSLFACVDGTKVVIYNISESNVEFLDREENKKITALYWHDDYLWICSSYSDIELYDLKRKILHRIQGSEVEEAEEYKELLSETNVVDIVFAGGTKYFVATWNGLFSLDFDSNELSKAVCSFHYMEYPSSVRTGKKITKLLWNDKQQLLWIGTFGSGSFQMYYAGKVFKTLKQTFNADISDIVEDTQGYIWVLTDKGKLWRSESNQLSVETVFLPWTKGLQADAVYRMYKGKHERIWLGDAFGNVVSINPSTEEATTFSLTPFGETGFSDSIRQFCLDSRDRLWIITTNGLVLFNYKTGKSKRMSAEYKGRKIQEINTIAEDKEGNIWLGTDIGLKRMEIQGETINLLGDYEQTIGLEVSPVYYIYVNGYNQILASYSDKILRIDGREKDKVENVFTLLDGLCSSHVYCMVDDENGNTWIGSNCGIMTIRNDRALLYNYASLGYSNEACRLRDGRLLWAGALGLIYFDPLMVKTEQNKNKVRLSEIRVNGEYISVGQKVHERVLLNTIPDVQRNFTFRLGSDDLTLYFSDLGYGIMQRKQLYRLLPDKEWKIGTLEDGVTLRYLPTGNYKLQVKLIYSDASESEVIEIPIQIRTYWWSTVWAKSGYIVVALSIMLVVYSYLERKRKRRKMHEAREMELRTKLDLTKLKQEQKQEVDAMRDRLLTKFMEELRTPLSLIMAPLREMLHDLTLPVGVRPKLQVAYRNSLGMLDACDQLLNIYTQDSLSGKLSVAPYSIDRMVDKVAFATNELVRINQMDFRCEKKNKRELEIWIDYKRIYFVLHNLLSNAFNHVRFSGVVRLLLQEVVREGVHYCVITVQDNGKRKVRGVSKATEDELCLNMSDLELGYDVMEKIVQLHHGTMVMKSLEGEGTEVVVELPVGKEIFQHDPNILLVDPEPEEEPEEELEKVNPIGDDYLRITPIPDETEVRVDSEIVSTAKRERHTLLIIEDHKDIRLYLKVLFDKEYDLFLATNGQEGVTLAVEEQPDLILCDVMMPVKDGFECCRELKSKLETCHIPFIMLTAKVEDEDIIHGLELGADDYILKPFTPDILKAKVHNLISGRMNLKQMYTNLLMPPENEEQKPDGVEEQIKMEDPFVCSVVKVIEESMCEPNFGVRTLALQLNMSQPTLYRKVKQSTDFTIVELIRRVRMRKAAMLLKQKRYAVQEVTEMIGYNDIPTFRKHFIDTFGITPSSYPGEDTNDSD